MEYLAVILLIVLLLRVVQRYLPADWQHYRVWLWISAGVVITYCLVTAPYRLARICQDVTQLLG